MRIIIDSIQASVMDTSTNTENDFLITEWITEYTVKFPPLQRTQVRGVLTSNVPPTPEAIINFLEDVYKTVDEKLYNQSLKSTVTKYDQSTNNKEHPKPQRDRNNFRSRSKHNCRTK